MDQSRLIDQRKGVEAFNPHDFLDRWIIRPE
jgi:hypothetical protein